MAIIRMRDTPMIGDQNEILRRRFPKARFGPRLDLSWGWEPHWTFSEIAGQKRVSTAATNGFPATGEKP
jgi:hypothetical protein